jgi:tRNA-2-methylthio-N6-dimethylallyladenosine synthase
MIYIGIYSNRPGTYADKHLPDAIPYKVKHARRNKLNELLKKISLTNNKQELGDTKTVLINEIINLSTYAGYTENMKQIIIQNPKSKIQNSVIKPGDFIQVKITKAAPFKLYGEIA